jgi:hypothetical protein
MDFAARWLSFLTHTHTHDFGNHSDGYDRSKIALIWSWRIAENYFFDDWKLENVSELGEGYSL